MVKTKISQVWFTAILFSVVAVLTSFSGLLLSKMYKQPGEAGISHDEIVIMRRALASLEATVTSLQTPKGNLPIGTVVAFWGNDAPDGWIMCDGRDIDPKHSELRNLVGENTPDLRGCFLRGLDETGKVDIEGKSRNIGHFQLDSTGEPKGGLRISINRPLLQGGRDPQHSGNDAFVPAVNEFKDVNAWRDNFSVIVKGWNSETRPKNIAANFIIKY